MRCKCVKQLNETVAISTFVTKGKNISKTPPSVQSTTQNTSGMTITKAKLSKNKLFDSRSTQFGVFKHCQLLLLSENKYLTMLNSQLATLYICRFYRSCVNFHPLKVIFPQYSTDNPIFSSIFALNPFS